ncbi:RING finger protein 122 isoform X4 [Paroedura picta]|uniref:RING finger protein 122 isoform X4 n=1 Tax=Paroedura picta TaxID=143630 RepID=UPI004055BEF3
MSPRPETIPSPGRRRRGIADQPRRRASAGLPRKFPLLLARRPPLPFPFFPFEAAAAAAGGRSGVSGEPREPRRPGGRGGARWRRISTPCKRLRWGRRCTRSSGVTQTSASGSERKIWIQRGGFERRCQETKFARDLRRLPRRL